MIQVFDKRYKSISNLFISTYEGFEYVFPSPQSCSATMGKEVENTNNEIVFVFSNYYDSPLVVDYYFDCFFYLLTYEYTLDTVYLKNLLHSSDMSETNGHKAIYNFISDDLTLNLGEQEIYDDYQRFKKTAVQITDY